MPLARSPVPNLTPSAAAPGKSLLAQTGIAVLVLALWTLLVAWLAVMILREIDAFSTANSDNLQWSLAQTDLEFLQLQVAIHNVPEDRATLDDLRLRFDIFYSRMATIHNGRLFRPLRSSPDFAAPFDRVQRFMTETVALIDGPDETLLAELGPLADRANAMTADVRAFSLAALTTFAELSDLRRNALSRLMVHMAAVLMVLFVGLVLLSISLFRLFRLARNRADLVEIASARLQTVVETSPNAIIVTDEAGCIEIFNTAAETLFGYDRTEVYGQSVKALFGPASEQGSEWSAMFAFAEERRRPRPEERNFEITLRDRTGRSIPTEISVDRAAAAQPLYVSYIRDISTWKDAEEQLIDARDRALAGERSKSRFLAVMSHEMRTPLNGLLGAIQLFRDHAMTERQSDLLDRMQQSGHLLLDLVNDVLDLAKFESGKMVAETTPFSISGVLDGVVQTAAPIAERQATALGWSWVGPPADKVTGDPRHLRHVLLNLVSNAVKFTRDGSVDIEVEQLPGTSDSIEFRVIDTGIGIAETDIERIFADFETLDSSYARDTEGTGLGLGIARRFTKLMGGTIGVESSVGDGSLFWIRLPLPQPGAAEAFENDKAGLAAPRPGAALDILVVEDNETNQFILGQMLEAAGHRVTLAANGRIGVDTAAQRRFDIILMDISMPEMDGTTAARAIRDGDGPNNGTPILALTAHAFTEERAAFRSAGMSACLTKPVDRAVLLSAISGARAGLAQGATVGTDGPPDRILDTRLVDQLLSDLPGPALAQLLARFRAETLSEIDRLARLDPSDPDIAPRAHHCAGSCGTFGLVALRLALKALETGAKRGTPPDAQALRDLPRLWQISEAGLLAHMDRRRAQ